MNHCLRSLTRSVSIVLFAVLIVVTVISTAQAVERIVQLDIPDMCASKEMYIGADIGALNGVTEIVTDLNALTCTITFEEDKINIETIKQALANMTLPVKTMKYIK